MVSCQHVFPDSKIPPGPVKAKKKRWTNSRALICPSVWVAHGRGPYVRITNFRRLFVWVKHIRRPIVLMTCNTCQGSVCPGDTCQDSVCLGDTCEGAICLGDTCYGADCPSDTYQGAVCPSIKFSEWSFVHCNICLAWSLMVSIVHLLSAAPPGKMLPDICSTQATLYLYKCTQTFVIWTNDIQRIGNRTFVRAPGSFNFFNGCFCVCLTKKSCNPDFQVKMPAMIWS